MRSAAALAREYELEEEHAIERARHGLLNFTLHTKPNFELNWHHRVTCQYMNRWMWGDIDRLIITAPPRHTKTEFVSRRAPALILGVNPDAQIIASSCGASLAQSINRDVQRIITDPAYKQLFPATRLNEKNVRTVADGSWLRNSEMFEVVGRAGYYLCAGVGGNIIGRGADYAIIDDPFKSWKDANSPTMRASVWDWYTGVLYTRLSKAGRVLITMTRWHEDDLVGRLMELMKADEDADRWVHLRLPAINEDGPSQDDPRQVGEALWPGRYPLTRLNRIRKNSERVFVANYQNRPSPMEGNIVKRTWWKLYTALPDGIDMWAASMDGTFKDKEKNDFCVFQIWARKGASKYLVHQVRARMAYTRQKATMRQLARDYPQVTAWWLEDSALASALKSDLDPEIPGIILVGTGGATKVMRAEAISPQIEAGNVFLPGNKPAGQGAPIPLGFVEALITEWATFPNGANDDQVDATSLGVSQLTETGNYDAVPEVIEKDSVMGMWRTDY